MGYLLLAIASSAAISIVMRLSADRVESRMSMLMANYLICAALGAAYTGAAPETDGAAVTYLLGALNGILLLASFCLLQGSIRRNGVVLSSVFMKLGLLVPIVLSVVLFGEVPTAVQAAGFFLALAAIVALNLRRDAQGGFSFGLILLLLLGGGADAMVKVFEVYGPAARGDQFLLLSFAAAFILCALLVLRARERLEAKALLFGAVIGVPNFFSSKFLLGALKSLPAVVVYPTYSVATMLIVTLCGVLCFRERLKVLQWCAFIAVIAALILLNL